MTHHKRKTRKHRRKTKSILKKTVDKSVVVVKNTSKKYMPKVKTGLESVGAKVIKSSKETIPYLQRLTRKFLGKLGVKSRKK